MLVLPTTLINKRHSPQHKEFHACASILNPKLRLTSFISVIFFYLHSYGGPGAQKVADTYGYGFESGYLVSNFNLIVVNLDARGTCCRGERFNHAVYKQIGKAEAEDTIAVAK
ncbi:PREDICTED: venom dipeptidyl peptidase 4-like [Acropora digitifera]|uniref:venom dipeptidyl peptidase 4-like n=1 Tax=Acropora digitifera TaxID=70779 RepID=UPI00077A7B78|nr:PREDICTED: venom dipeptidyl peptidase 4-like [Acropora digitifera]